jgi:hypothetical protein
LLLGSRSTVEWIERACFDIIIPGIQSHSTNVWGPQLWRVDKHLRVLSQFSCVASSGIRGTARGVAWRWRATCQRASCGACGKPTQRWAAACILNWHRDHMPCCTSCQGAASTGCGARCRKGLSCQEFEEWSPGCVCVCVCGRHIFWGASRNDQRVPLSHSDFFAPLSFKRSILFWVAERWPSGKLIIRCRP